ncbi:methyl-accepting chemotaxis protein [Clostridium sp. AL.422]|uniref:methyl-accepting chemotaxis protein n=1 Tax=Clostridium TaxID=1485 RepID=UPI00293DBB32|nr:MULTISPECIES: methyl-accepting chemotaxis protein [unclassified Clostridium]MDV4149633.1 methyl-accepting chemotaxis protein [Clostridium sp. AL.422]
MMLKKRKKEETKSKSIGRKILTTTIIVTVIAMGALLSINTLNFDNLLSSIEKNVMTHGKNVRGAVSTADIEVVLKNKITGSYDYEKLKKDLINGKSNENINYASILIKDSNGEGEILVDTESNLLNFGKKIKIANEANKAFNGEIISVEMKEKNKTSINVYYPMKTSNGEIISVLQISNDITDIIMIRNTILLQLSIISLVLLLTYSIMSLLISKSINKKVKDIISSLVTISEGNLTNKINIKGNDEINLIANYINKLQDKISIMIDKIMISSDKEIESIGVLSDSSKEMAAAAEEVTAIIQEVDSNIFIQNEDTKRINSLLYGFGKLIEEVKISVSEINKLLLSINNKLDLNNKSLIELQSSKRDIQDSSLTMNQKLEGLHNSHSKIKDITTFIDSIADQTNLLALNAAIEAARVGESGKGFTVVANEIRKLAEEVKSSSLDINNILRNVIYEGEEAQALSLVVNNKLFNQFEVIDNSIVSFNEIVNSLVELFPKIVIVNNEMDTVLEEKNIILKAIEKSRDLLDGISRSSEEIKNFSKELSIMAQGIANVGEELSENTNGMNEEINKFTVK